jgi:ABC-type protease/lipase transport system fused ATPase/permease subunit
MDNKLYYWKTKKKYFDKLILITGIINLTTTTISFYFIENFNIALASIWYSLFFYLIYYSFIFFTIIIFEVIDRSFNLRKNKTMNITLKYSVGLVVPFLFYSLSSC